MMKKSILKIYMNLFSQIDKVDPRWEGYAIARNAATEAERQNALLEISKARYKESKRIMLDEYFKTDLRDILRGKDVLEVGSNHGGASLAYFELYELKSITGIDTTESQIETSKLFFKNKGVHSGFSFVKAFAEHLPFASNSFDAIISFDVFEHVMDLSCVMSECFRVLRSGGKLLAVFPSFYQPLAHHLKVVTYAPCVHWFFSPGRIMDIFWEILDENPVYRDYKGLERRPLLHWEKLLGINGTTLSKFRKIISENPWSGIQHIRLPLGSVGSVSREKPFLKFFRYVFYLGTMFPVLEEVCNHRIVCILTK